MAATPRLGGNLAAESPPWADDPSGVTVVDAAREWLQHRIARRLLTRGWTAQRLVEVLGGSASSWQNKLNGNRKIQFEDLLALAIAVDAQLLGVLPHEPEDLRDFLPPDYGDWLSHWSLDAGMPTFREPEPGADWSAFANNLEAWWHAEEDHGRAWAITREVLVHAVLVHSRDAGLEPASAAVAADVESHVDLDWPARQTRVRVLWQHGHGGRPESSAVGQSVAHVARCLWEMAELPELEKVLILAAPRVIATNLIEAAGLDAGAPAAWSVVGLTEAHRLGCESSVLASGDIHVQVLQPPIGNRIACFRVK